MLRKWHETTIGYISRTEQLVRRMLLRLLLLVTCFTVNVSHGMDSNDPADWLEMMIVARKSLTYQGTFVFSRGDEISSMRVLHQFKDGVEQERLIALDGEPREIVRHGDRVICIFPGNEQVRLEQALPDSPFRSAIKNIAPLKMVYSIKVAGQERVAGYEVVKVALMAKDQYRYSYLLWLEKSSGLLVKSVLTGHQGKILERFQFTSLQIGDDITDEVLTGDISGLSVTHKKPQGVKPSGAGPLPHGWQLQWLPKGFKPAEYMSKRNSIMPEVSRTRVYSDGLAVFSVFVEPQPEAEMPAGSSKMGATVAHSHYVEIENVRYVVTIVGEVPLATAKKIAGGFRMFGETEES